MGRPSARPSEAWTLGWKATAATAPAAPAKYRFHAPMPDRANMADRQGLTGDGSFRGSFVFNKELAQQLFCFLKTEEYSG